MKHLSPLSIRAATTLEGTGTQSVMGQVDDWNLSADTINRVDFTPLSTTAALSGIANGTNGRTILIRNSGSSVLRLLHNSSSSLSANRLRLPFGRDAFLVPFGAALLQHTGSHWQYCEGAPGDGTQLYGTENLVVPLTTDGSYLDSPMRNVYVMSPLDIQIIEGFQNISPGRTIKVINRSATGGVIAFQHNASTLGEQIFLPDAMPFFLFPGEFASFIWVTDTGVLTEGTWHLLESSRPAGLNQYLEASDMHGGIANSCGPFTCLLTGTSVSGQTGNYLANSTERPNGIYQIDTGTTATGRIMLGSAQVNCIPCARGAAIFLARVAPETSLSDGTNRYQVRCGFTDQGSGATPTEGIYWEYDDTASTAWRMCSTVAGVSAKANSGLTVSTNYTWLGIAINFAWDRARFFWSTDSSTWTFETTQVVSSMDSLFTSVGCGIAKSVGTTQRNLAIDFMGLTYKPIRG